MPEHALDHFRVRTSGPPHRRGGMTQFMYPEAGHATSHALTLEQVNQEHTVYLVEVEVTRRTAPVRSPPG